MTSDQTCPRCNAELPENARFCPGCGHRLGPDTVPRPVLDERTWAALTHLAAFAGVLFPLGNVLAPLIIWIIKRPQSALVEHHGKQALNFQLSLSIYVLVSLLLIVAVVGIFLTAACLVFWVVMVIVAAVRASNGEDPGYVLSIKFLK